MNINNASVKEFVRSKIFKRTLCGIGIILVALLILQVGIFVGYRKASFSYKYGDNYYRTFGGERGEFGERRGGGMMGMMGFLNNRDFPNSHGVIGKIIKIELPIFVTLGQDGVEKIVLVTDDTIIKRFRDTVNTSELKVSDNVVVVGSPNENTQIEAKLIRILPATKTPTVATSTPKI